MTAEKICLCLPKGEAMESLKKRLEEIDFPIKDYHSKNRSYRPEVEDLPVRAKILAEKDVALQIAAGNYDVGFCGMDWIREHAVKYRATKLHVFKHLGLDKRGVYACTAMDCPLGSVEDLHGLEGFTSIVSEYPNIAESFAIHEKLRKFKVFSAWGSVEAYPPEHADVVILSVYEKESLTKMGLREIKRELDSDLCLVVNRDSLVEKDLSPVLKFF
ncbi:MAG: ATP phosphoribosyltransferase [Desulfobacterales bacterium]|nr:ATP phosphoribosyltransferase [Desulfobacterales bacterium]